jgi:lysophospholipase L1-like esterase
MADEKDKAPTMEIPAALKGLSMDTVAAIGKTMLDFSMKDKADKMKKVADYTPKEGIVFIGDSITDGYPVVEMLSPYVVFNRGISGDTSLQMEEHLPYTVYKIKPKKVFILIGTNDFGNGAKTEEVFQNIDRIIKEIKKNVPETKIYLQSVYPVNHNLKASSVYGGFDMVGIRNNKDIQDLNKKLKMIKGITFIDIYQALCDKEGNFNPAYTEDGLHPNNYGYQAISAFLKPYLAD